MPKRAARSASPRAAEVLRRDGPLVDVEIRARCADGSACRPVRGKALVDSGADRTAVDTSVMEGVEPDGVYWAQGVTSEAVPLPIYRLKLGFPDTALGELEVERAAGTPHLGSQGLIALLGRDALQHGRFTHDGPSGTFALSLPGGTTRVEAKQSLLPLAAAGFALVLGAVGAWALVPGCGR